MAQRIVTVLTDDLDHTEAEDVTTYRIADPEDGTLYEIDLSNKNAKALKAALDKLLPVARKVPLHAQPTARTRTGKVAVASAHRSRQDLSSVREWARSNGYELSDRGRIPGNIMEAYEQGRKASA